MKCLLCLLLIWSNLPCRAQTVHHLPAQSYATATAYSRFQPDAFCFDKNPALLGNLKTVQAGFYAGQRFMMEELSFGAAAIALPVGNSRFGLALQHEGGSRQHRSNAGFSFAQTLGSKGSLGVVAQYGSVATAGYGAVTMLGIGLGGAVQITPALQGGFALFKHAAGGGKYAAEKFAALYQVGLGYDCSEEVFISAVFEKREGVPPEVQAALSYRFSDKISSRIGLQTGTGQYFFGGGFRTGQLQLHVFGSMHPRLGFTPGLQVLFSVKEKQ